MYRTSLLYAAFEMDDVPRRRSQRSSSKLTSCKRSSIRCRVRGMRWQRRTRCCNALPAQASAAWYTLCLECSTIRVLFFPRYCAVMRGPCGWREGGAGGGYRRSGLGHKDSKVGRAQECKPLHPWGGACVKQIQYILVEIFNAALCVSQDLGMYHESALQVPSQWAMRLRKAKAGQWHP